MIRKLFCAGLLLGAVLGSGQSVPRPDVPDKIKAPANEQVILVAHASGSQIYTCQQAPDGKYGWTLKAPEADLHDQQGLVIGHHFAGPTWKHKDGSEITGKAAAKVDSPEVDSVPWLLVSVTGHSGDGVFTRVTTIQRINTHGGQPPPVATCTGAQEREETKRAYTADYYFYAPAK